MVKAYLRLFRAVNLPTVPGDLFVGMAAVLWGEANTQLSALTILASSLAAVFLYMAGLADNDIVGAKTDKARPISEGLISLGVARILRCVCFIAAFICALWGSLEYGWWICAILLTFVILFYNRSKKSWLMGLCRALNLICGAAAIGSFKSPALYLAAAVWFIYITFVTHFSQGEEFDEKKKRAVGMMIGLLVYLQMAALMIFTGLNLKLLPLLIIQIVMIVFLRIFKRLMTGVSAS